MPRRSFTNAYALDVLCERQNGVVTYQQLIELGLPATTLSNKIRTGGPWQRPLPHNEYGLSKGP